MSHLIKIDPTWPESFRDPGFWGEGAKFENDRMIPEERLPQVGLTKRQQEVLAYIAKTTLGQGYSPSYREIMEGVGWRSTSNVARVVDALVARGYLRKLRGAKRCLSAA